MICGYCGEFSTKKVETMQAHWMLTGCPWGRLVWVRYFESRAAGHSGRRILHEAWPELWPSEPMDEEARERLREAEERRKASGVKRAVPWKGGKRVETVARRREPAQACRG